MRSPVSLRRAKWSSIAGLTILGTLGCLAFSVGFDYMLRYFGDPGWSRLALVTVVPFVIAGPLWFFIGMKLHELGSLQKKYADRLIHDGLTGCLNGPVFSSFVEVSIGVSRSNERAAKGALLIIDVDHFRAANERFGHGWGDRALRKLADVIRASVRAGDLVGRVGGQEFGVFLPGASRANAEDVAERIRAAIAELDFGPGRERGLLTVSVGAALFEEEVEFEEIFRAASQRVRQAKDAGRNRIEYSYFPSRGAETYQSPRDMH